MSIQILMALMIAGAISTCAVAALRNRNVAVWFVLGAAMPVLSLFLLTALERPDIDGNPVGRCCPHCPCRERLL